MRLFPLNDYISEKTSSFRYVSILEAITVIRTFAACFVAETDIKSAFRIITIPPSDFPLLDMKCDRQLHNDVCLPMGLFCS